MVTYPPCWYWAWPHNVLGPKECNMESKFKKTPSKVITCLWLFCCIFFCQSSIVQMGVSLDWFKKEKVQHPLKTMNETKTDLTLTVSIIQINGQACLGSKHHVECAFATFWILWLVNKQENVCFYEIHIKIFRSNTVPCEMLQEIFKMSLWMFLVISQNIRNFKRDTFVRWLQETNTVSKLQKKKV